MKTSISKEQLQDALETVGDNKDALANHFGCGTYSIRSHLKFYDLNIDRRAESNLKKDGIPPPPKEELELLYTIENKTMTEIGVAYGVSNVTAMKWVKGYGIDVLSQSDTIRYKALPKAMETNKVKYGNEHFFATEEGKQKITNSFMTKYGVPYNPNNGIQTSSEEMEVLNYVNSLVPGFEKSRHLGFELDMFNKDIMVAIEYCGLYWHNETNKGKDSHIKKYKACVEAGIHLLTIFSDEWCKRKSQVKGFIRSTLGKNEIRIGARTLRVEVMDRNNYRALDFLEKNHIQGSPIVSQIINHYALVDDGGHIMCIVSIGNHHRGNEGIILSRFCGKSNVTVSGGASKLFSKVIQDFPDTPIKTWSDNRWSDGGLYKSLGFTNTSVLPKDYSYVNGNTRKSKQSMTRKSMGASEGQTEYERAVELKFDRIWDCGKMVWEYNTGEQYV